MVEEIRWQGGVARKVLRTLEDGAKTTAEIAEACGERPQAISKVMRDARKFGRASHEELSPKVFRYALTQKGADYLRTFVERQAEREWTDAKLSFLSSHYGDPDWPLHRIAAHLGYGRSTVQRKAASLNLTGNYERPTNWTQERIALLRDAYEDGKTAEEIAELCGSTLHAVRSILYRNGLTKTTRKRKRPAERTWLNAAPVQEVPETAKPWLERAFGECAYPVCGEGADVWSCCAKVVSGSYCDGHKVIMWRVDERSERRRAA